MKSLKERITPSFVISMLALFVALGGASYAALGANSVGSKQLKKNAVVTGKIKNNAVTTPKIKGDAVTGAKVKESSLGVVPEADHAGQADTAASADTATTAETASSANTAASADSAENFDGYHRLGVVRLQSTASNPSSMAAQAAATEVPLFELGSITVYAKCYTSGGSLYASHYLKTSANGAIFDSQYTQAYGSPSYLDTGTPEDQRVIYYTTAGMDSYGYASNPEPTFVATAAGEAYMIDTRVVVKQGTLPGGDGAYGPGNVCVYTGTAQEM